MESSTLEDETIGCPEASVNLYQYTLCDIPRRVKTSSTRRRKIEFSHSFIDFASSQSGIYL
jgi:hypothetical protein